MYAYECVCDADPSSAQHSGSRALVEDNIEIKITH